MTKLRALVNYCVSFIATIALSGLCTVFCASRIVVRNVICEGVTRSSDFFLLNKNLVASRAVFTCGKACFCTSRSLCFIKNFSVSKLFNILCVGVLSIMLTIECHSTNCTTSRSLGFYAFIPSMSTCVNTDNLCVRIAARASECLHSLCHTSSRSGNFTLIVVAVDIKLTICSYGDCISTCSLYHNISVGIYIKVSFRLEIIVSIRDLPVCITELEFSVFFKICSNGEATIAILCSFLFGTPTIHCSTEIKRFGCIHRTVRCIV